MKISIRWKRAEEVFGNLLRAYHAGAYPYGEHMVLPQDASNLPPSLPRGGREEALFFLAVCYYMRLTESVGAVRKLSRLYEFAPEYFFPETFDEAVERHGNLVDILIQFGLRFQAGAAAYGWEVNLRKVQSYWGGDPRNLFKGAQNYAELCRRMLNPKSKARPKKPMLFGSPYGLFLFQHKMVSMLTYFYVSVGLVSPILHPVPVDFHVLRMLLSTEIVVGPKPHERINSSRVGAAAREVTVWYCKEHGADPIDLCNVLWHISRKVCKVQYGNRSDVKMLPPKEGLGQRERYVITPLPPIKWTTARKKHYRLHCGHCPVSDACRFNVPIAPYSKLGKLHLRGERPKPPQHLMLLRV